MKKTRALLLVFSGSCLLALMSCSNSGMSGMQIQENGDLSTRRKPASPLPLGVSELIQRCDEAKSLGKLQSTTMQIDFEDNIGECDWNKDGNLSTKNGFARARAEQVRNVPLPADSVVCQIDLEDLDEQNFQYDDNIILTLNNYLLASTTDFTNHFEMNNGYYIYDWNRLADQPGQSGLHETSAAKQYCAGESLGLSSCLFPQTETLGRLQMQFDERVIQNILGVTKADDIQLAMITTGDDDSTTDCHHNPIRLKVQVDYIE